MNLEEKCGKLIKRIKGFGKTAVLAGMLWSFSACEGDSGFESEKESAQYSFGYTEQAIPEYVKDTIRGVPLSVSKHPSTQSRYYKDLDEGGIAIGLYTQDRGLILAKDEGFKYPGGYSQFIPLPHDHSASQYVAIEALIDAEMKLDKDVEITLVGKDVGQAFFFDEIILPSYTIKLYDDRTKESYIKRTVD